MTLAKKVVVNHLDQKVLMNQNGLKVNQVVASFLCRHQKSTEHIVVKIVLMKLVLLLSIWIAYKTCKLLNLLIRHRTPIQCPSFNSKKDVHFAIQGESFDHPFPKQPKRLPSSHMFREDMWQCVFNSSDDCGKEVLWWNGRSTPFDRTNGTHYGKNVSPRARATV